MKIHMRRGSLARFVIPIAGVAAAMALTAAIPAQASVAQPTALKAAAEEPTFSFADCPKLAANHDPVRSDCVNAVVVGGKITAGSLTQDLTKPIRMTYGFLFDKDTRRHVAVFGTLKGEEFKVKDGIFHDPLTEVHGKAQYAGVFASPPSADFRIKLGMKLALTRPFLVTAGCEIGSNADPISLDLTTATTNPPPPNQPITGKPVTHIRNDGYVKIYTATHVDNAFRVPGASGCYLNTPLRLVDKIINSQAGLPSAQGRNAMIMDEYIGRVSYAHKP